MPNTSPASPTLTNATPNRLRFVVVPIVLVALFWAFTLISPLVEVPMFGRFISRIVVSAVLVLGFAIWWLFASGLAWSERLLAVGLVALGAVLACRWGDPSMSVFGVLFWLLPRIVTAWLVLIWLARKTAPRVRHAGLTLVVAALCLLFTLVRVNGLSGEQESDIAWRWTPTAEERFLAAHKSAREAAPAQPAAPLTIGPGDWPAFRGAGRDGVVQGVRVATNWHEHPPKLAWRHAVGPGWSSVSVVAGRVFTQEQRGPHEAVVCYDAAAGDERWAHTDEVRFSEGVSGAGPRATPTFAAGRIYTLGATGLVNCLDAATGRVYWTRNMATDAGSAPPLWGFSCSPLVVDGVVVVHAGGEHKKQVLAYKADSGDLAWTAQTGAVSYSSPLEYRLDNARDSQVLILSDAGLQSLASATGELVWEFAGTVGASPRSLMPHLVGPATVLVPSDSKPALNLIDVARQADTWSVKERWASRAMRSSFNDFVVHQEHIYGFDGTALACAELATGKRLWKKGRYGHGQVVLLAEQGLLLVIGEQGEAALVRAAPDQQEELCRFAALSGKTWNSPAVAQGRLYLRNGEELACYEIASRE